MHKQNFKTNDAFYLSWLLVSDVTMNCEPVENRLKYVTIQIGWDAKQIAIQLE